MKNVPATTTNQLPVNYPFLEDVYTMRSRSRSRTKTHAVEDGVIERTVTVTVKDEYIPLRFTKLYHNREMLLQLSSNACRILVRIGCTLPYDAHKIQLRAQDSGLEKRAFLKAIDELIKARVLAKEKREHYWVNVAVVIVGNTPQPPNGFDVLSEE